ncbi:MAG: hypothetical protein KC621_18015 [Myxococcales bacterium]|nr:hypothetical protein [Myxococcales bacterium]
MSARSVPGTFRSVLRPVVVLAGLCVAGILVAPRDASACDETEKLRLAEEQRKLASRNAWTGVERMYDSLLETKCELGFEQHYLGAEAAKLLGKVLEQHERLTVALASAPTEVDPDHPERSGEAIQSAISAIEADYRRVDIQGDPRRRPVLTRPEMPFATDQRKAIEWAQTVVSETGSFKGMLPFGAYVVGDQEFTLEAGEDFVLVQVGKVKKPPPGTDTGNEPVATGPTTNEQSFLRYGSLVATVGPGILASPETAKVVDLADGGNQFAPSSVFASGFGVQVGAEVGLTYAEPALGLAATVGYNGGFGTDTLNALNVWLAGVARPGDLRLAAGPMYQVTLGSGTGVASWFDRDHAPVTNDTIGYSGLGYGGGAQVAVGYGLLDLDKLQGLVELGGAWQTDLARSYYQVGLRVGIVPMVPRFKG